ncbi:MAG TPA: hypothetical protein HPP77_10165 [Candidatus Hydrogenedentes bacterium]|nr:hypothetical protein [Candidatus Hydrogenedentota bacterium]HIJ74771.1 hypothetical protein [Candidatus Hydrogenedentota bacterium]
MLLACMLAVLAGCGHVDGIIVFKITGDVRDLETGEPVEGATVTFIDFGISEDAPYGIPASQEIDLCETDSDGNIDVRFEYWWGESPGPAETVRFLTGTDTVLGEGPFAVALEKEGYEPTILHFNSEKLPSVEGDCEGLPERVVDLGEVYIQPIAQLSSVKHEDDLH